MKKIIAQVIKFGIVGVICFFIDFGITIYVNKLGVHYLIAKSLGFIVAGIINYILSIKYVFLRNDLIEKKKEVFIFFLLASIGLVINELIMFIYVEVLYEKVSFLKSFIPEQYIISSGIIVATAVVMCYNFITRKLLLERKKKVGLNNCTK